MTTTTPPTVRLLPKSRLDAFSDGVFAIAVTLLVLELEVPAGEGHLATALREEWASYLGYLISFAFIGGAWIAHSATTQLLSAVDAGLMRLNLLLLLAVSFLPFTTSLMATHLNRTDARTVTVLFGINLTLVALMSSTLIRYAAARPELGVSVSDEAELRSFERERRVAVLLQAGATVLALPLPIAATGVFLAISLLLLLDPLWRLPRGRSRQGASRNAETSTADAGPTDPTET